MFYCGIDIASKSSYLFVTTKSGRKVGSGEVETTREAFEIRLKRYGKDGLVIAIEAGNQTAWIYDALVAMGAKVTVVNPTKVRLIAESRRKTDKIDAKTLCQLLRLDALPHPVHMPGKEARELRGLLVARRQLISARTKLCNVVRGRGSRSSRGYAMETARIACLAHRGPKGEWASPPIDRTSLVCGPRGSANGRLVNLRDYKDLRPCT